jgi:hypothetical protein
MKNKYLGIAQGVFAFLGIWGLIAMLFFQQEGTGELGLLIEINNSIKGAGMSISFFLAIIALQMFKDNN